MKRREAIKKSGWILQSAVFAPGLVSAIQSCQPKLEEADGLIVLSGEQHTLANAIADTIIPKTESPSASEVKVVEFIDLLLKDVFEQEVVDSFLTGLETFDDDCRDARGNSFSRLNQKERNSYLQRIDESVMSKEYDSRAPFYFTFKKLCITTYYSTEQGVKQNLNYQPVPGAYQADVELKDEDVIMVGNNM